MVSRRALSVVAIAAAGVPPAVAAAQGVESAANDVHVHVPEVYQPDDEDEAAIPLIAGRPDAGKQFFYEGRGVLITILELPLSSPRETLPEQPSTQVPGRLGRSYLGGLLKTGLGKPTRDKATIVLDLDDPVHKMRGIEVQSTTMSLAQWLLAKDDASPNWQELKQGGLDPKRFRCMMSTMIAAYASGADPVSTSVTSCGASKESASALIESMTPDAFKPREVVERFIEIVTDNGVTIVRIQGDRRVGAEVASVWREILQFTTVESDGRRELGNRPWRTDPMARLWGVLGVSLGGLILYCLYYLVRRAKERANRTRE